MGPRICMERIDNDENDDKDSFKFMIVENVGRNTQQSSRPTWANLIEISEASAKTKEIAQNLVNERIRQQSKNPQVTQSDLGLKPMSPTIAPVVHDQYKSDEHKRYDELVQKIQSENFNPKPPRTINEEKNKQQIGSAGKPKFIKTSENAWFLFEKRKHMRIVYKGAFGAKFVKFAGKWERLSSFKKRIV